jgi:hypothetical protein
VIVDNQDFANGFGHGHLYAHQARGLFTRTLSRRRLALAMTFWSFFASDNFYINGVPGSDSDLLTTIGGLFPLQPPTYTRGGWYGQALCDGFESW